MVDNGTPAAMDTTHAPGRSTFPISRNTDGTTSGLMATMTVSARAAASRLPTAWTPWSAATRRARAPSASATNTLCPGTRPACTMPPTSASPMAPAPMHATISAMSAIHLEIFEFFQLRGAGHFDGHVAGRKQEERLAQTDHAAVQRVGRAADKVHQTPSNFLGHQLHGQNDGASFFQAVGHHLHVVEADRALHDHAHPLTVAGTSGARQADQPSPPRVGAAGLPG